MPITFYQIEGDAPGTSIYINPLHVVRIVPNGNSCKVHLTDKMVYDIGQTASVVHAKIQNCLK
ncbi:MAG: hypothetical protein JNK79_03040 [Chitinophagaceae bacterium]|nr:hypothetical protein [Chitinophagaceae bacterium]